MKKILPIILLFTGTLLCVAANDAPTSSTEFAQPLRLDASDAKKMQDSFMQMLASLDGGAQQNFAAAMATIGVYYMQDARHGGNEAMKAAIENKTADEIIALSRKLFPNIKQNTKIVDGSSPDKFGRSVAEILISLSPEKQTQFSEAVAKFMYDAQKEKLNEAAIMKKLDGKTASEVIALAAGISTPFDNPMATTPKDYTMRKMTEEEIKKIRKNKNSADEPDYDTNLSPSSIIKKKNRGT